jgi:hypothetical protein
MATDNFLMLIGAPKCGTSSLASWLDRHDKVVLMPGKEPGYFRTLTDKRILNAHRPDVLSSSAPTSAMVNFDTYMTSALAAAPDQWILDGSTDYLSDDHAADRIKAFAVGRSVKLICVLRDPVERALSEYRHTIRDGLEPLSLTQAIAQEETRRLQNYQPLFQHIRRSQYHDDIQRFRALFGEDLIVMSLADFSDVDRCARRLFDFIGLPAADLGVIGLENTTSQPPVQAGALRRLYRQAKKTLTGAHFPGAMPQTTMTDRAILRDCLADDIRKCVMDPSIPTDDWDCARDMRFAAPT